MNLTDKLQNVGRNAALTTALAMPAGYVAPQADAATVQSIDLIDNDSAGYDILNNDGVEYNTLFLDLSPTLDNLSAATGISKDDLYTNLDASIQGSPEGDVDAFWDLTKTLDYRLQAEDQFDIGDNFTDGLNMYILVNFNGLPVDKPLMYGDVNSELVEANTGNGIGASTFYAPGNDLTAVPEPTSGAIGLLGLGALAMYNTRRRRD